MPKIARFFLTTALVVLALVVPARADFVIDVPDVSVASGGSSTIAVNEFVANNQTTNLFVNAAGIHIKYDQTLLTVTNVYLGNFDSNGTDYNLTVNQAAIAGGDIVVSISLRGGHSARQLTTSAQSFILIDFTAATVATTTTTPINIVLSAPLNSGGGNLATSIFTRNVAAGATGTTRAFNPAITNGANDISDGVVTIRAAAVPEPGSIALLTIGSLGFGLVLRRRRAVIAAKA